MRGFVLMCGLAALVPCVSWTAREGAASATLEKFPGWPAEFEGRLLRELPMGEREKRFAEGFPGRIGRFHDGERELIVRWVTAGTRRLHPAVDCFAGMGYRVAPLPIEVDSAGARWGCFHAERGGEKLQVRERITETGNRTNSWTDVSAWYWAAALGRTSGPWWATTVARRENQ